MGVRDLEIARAVKLRPIQEIAETLGLGLDDLELYGRFKAKVRWEAIARASGRPDGALVLVTAMTPTPAGDSGLGLGGAAHGVPREGGFEITVASEVMAILCLARDLADFKARVERIIVAETPAGDLVEARALKAAGAMAVLMKDAIKPNLVQTLEGTPAFVHGGPFGNIA